MLRFEETSDGFKVIETTYSALKTKIMTVTYSKDLSTKQVNNDPVRQMTDEDKNWFSKYYAKHFKNIQVEE